MFISVHLKKVCLSVCVYYLLIMEQSDHSISSHKEKLNQLCRICGQRSSKKYEKRPPKQCESYASSIEAVYKINIQRDTDGIHSKTMCFRCYARMSTLSKSGSSSDKKAESARNDVETSRELWTEFKSDQSDSECRVCNTFNSQCKGGRPLKPNHRPNRQHQRESGSVFSPPSTSTPFKPSDVTTSTITSPSLTSIEDLPDEETEIEPPSSPEMVPNRVTIDCASSPFGDRIRSVNDITFPFTHAEEKLKSKMNRISMKNSKDGKTVKNITGGKPFFLRRIITSQCPSGSAKTPTKAKRAREIRKFRKEMAGQSEGDILTQMQAEMKGTCKKTARSLFKNVVKTTGQMTARDSVRLQSQMGVSNTKHKLFRKFMRKKGFPMCTEEEEKQFRSTAECGPVNVNQNAVFFYTKDTVTTKETPVAKIADLRAFVTNILNKLDKKVSI